MWPFVVLTAVLLAACAIKPTEQEMVRVTAFSQRLIGPGPKGEPQIYEKGNEFTYQVNGTCIANGQKMPCMSHGFELSFEAPDDLSILNCSTQSSRPIGVADPTSLQGSNVSTFNWTLKLEGRSGRIVNPRYAIQRPGAQSQKYHSATRCLYEDQEALKFEFTILVPPNNALQLTQKASGLLRQLSLGAMPNMDCRVSSRRRQSGTRKHDTQLCQKFFNF
jgi:hypothetical protein